MKFIKSVLLGFLFLLSTVSLSFASEGVKVQNGKECIDLKVVYEQNNLASQAITGEEKSLDSVKRAETITSLTNIIGLLLGDSIYCVNDEVAASKADSFSDKGVFGFLSDSMTQTFSIFNTIDVTGHLAKEFVPGYGGNNATLAQKLCYNNGGAVCTEGSPNCFCAEVGGGEGGDSEIDPGETADGAIDNLVGKVGNIDEGEIQEAIDRENQVSESLSGYDYLKKVNLDSAWSVTRNIAYVFFVIVMIIIGFMIMFRNKIGGQLMVTVGNTIPRVIISLVLVTFSFAIVGIMLDVGKVGMALVNGVFYQAEKSLGAPSPEEVDIGGITRLSDQALYNLNTSEKARLNQETRRLEKLVDLDAGKELVDNNEGKGATLRQTGLVTVLGVVSGVLEWVKSVKLSEAPVIGAVGPVELSAKTLVGFFQGVALTFLVRYLLVLLIALYASIKLFITMITTYFKIFISVIIAPLQLALGALPGNQNGMMNWFKSTFANILVFVVIVAVLRAFRFLSNVINPADFNFYGNKGVFFPEWIVTMKGIFIVASYLIAANAPTMVSGFMKIEENKTMSAVGGAAKASMSKIPLIGGMFGGK